MADAKAAGFAQYAARFVGREREVVVEKLDAATGEGLSDNYLRIAFDRFAGTAAAAVRKGDLARLRITGPNSFEANGSQTLRGEVLGATPPA